MDLFALATGTTRPDEAGEPPAAKFYELRDRNLAGSVSALRPCAIILYMTTLPVAEARAQLSRIVDEAARTHERFEITRSGQRVAVLLGADDYDSLRETIAVLGDAELLRAHFEGVAALAASDSLDAEGLARSMRSAGRLTPPR